MPSPARTAVVVMPRRRIGDSDRRTPRGKRPGRQTAVLPRIRSASVAQVESVATNSTCPSDPVHVELSGLCRVRRKNVIRNTAHRRSTAPGRCRGTGHAGRQARTALYNLRYSAAASIRGPDGAALAHEAVACTSCTHRDSHASGTPDNTSRKQTSKEFYFQKDRTRTNKICAASADKDLTGRTRRSQPSCKINRIVAPRPIRIACHGTGGGSCGSATSSTM